MFSARRWMAAVLVTFSLVACDEGTHPTAPDPGGESVLFSGPEMRSVTQDTVWGSNQTMEATDNGTTVKIQRFGSEGAWTHAKVWIDGTYAGQIDLGWSGGSIDQYTWMPNGSSEHVVTDDVGDPVDSSIGDGDGCEFDFEPLDGCDGGIDDGPGDDGPGGGGTESFTICLEDFSTLQEGGEGPCADEGEEMREATGAAVVIGGLGALVTKATAGAAAAPALVATTVAAGNALWQTLDWLACKVVN